MFWDHVLTRALQVKTRSPAVSVLPRLNGDSNETGFIPLLRSGAWVDIGSRSSMADVYVCADNLVRDYGLIDSTESPSAFYGVDWFIVEDEDFPQNIERIIASAFLHADTAFGEACSSDADLDSGTNALAAVVIGRSLVVANAGDYRAVLCRRGKAVEISRDHKPICLVERKRIEASGGHIYDGYLNGQLNVARALGDWHMEGLKGRDGGPLGAEPELMKISLTGDDEFPIISCDGLWDIFMSQKAVDFARKRLQEQNDPIMCSKDLVDEALKSLAVVVVCFHQPPPLNVVVPRGRLHQNISAKGLKELQSFFGSLQI